MSKYVDMVENLAVYSYKLSGFLLEESLMPTQDLPVKVARLRETVQSSLKSTIQRELAEDSQISRLMFSKSTHSKSATNTAARKEKPARTQTIDDALIDQIAARLSGADSEA